MGVQAGAIGVTIVYRVYQADGVTPMDVSVATVKKLIFMRPNFTVLQVDADFYTDGTDGLLKYVTTDADELAQYGKYKAQAYIETPSYQGKTEVALFDVLENAA